MTHAVPDAINVLWFIPTHGDSRYLGTSEGGRAVDLPYLKQIAQAADQLGYYGALLPTGRSCEDSWVVASALAPLTERLRFLVAVRPGLQSPTLAARMTATLDRISNGRLLINVVTGGDPKENGGDGIFLGHAERYEVTREFLDIYKRILSGETVEHEGKHFRISDGRLLFPPVQTPHPPLYFGGSSNAANDVAAEQIDKYLTWGEPPALVAEKIETVRALAEKKGRRVTFGIRLHVIVRETTSEAWAAAERARSDSALPAAWISAIRAGSVSPPSGISGGGPGERGTSGSAPSCASPARACGRRRRALRAAVLRGRISTAPHAMAGEPERAARLAAQPTAAHGVGGALHPAQVGRLQHPRGRHLAGPPRPGRRLRVLLHRRQGPEALLRLHARPVQ